jgi:hypothetical protein
MTLLRWPDLGEIIEYGDFTGPVSQRHMGMGFFVIHAGAGYYNIDLKDYHVARETKEARIAREEAARQQEFLDKIAVRAEMPARLVKLQALALQVGISTTVSLEVSGPAVRFFNPNDHEEPYVDETLTYESEDWEAASVEHTLQRLKAEYDARAAARFRAQEIFSALSPADKIALKSYIHFCR